MTSPFLYAGINPEVWQTLRFGALARGHAEPRQVPRPADVSAETLAGITHVFVDGPAVRLARVLEGIAAAGLSLLVVWIARDSERQRAEPDLAARAGAVWPYPGPALSWVLDGEDLLLALPETPVLAPSGVGAAEGERLAFLEAGDFAAEGRDARLDRLTGWVSAYFGYPIAFVNLVGRELQTARSTHGLPDNLDMSMPREMSICQYVVAGNQPLVIPDIPNSDFFGENGIASLVGMEAYVGVPLVNDHQLVLGSLCMVDMQPRTVTLTQLGVLQALAAVAVEALNERRTTDGRLQMSSAAFHALGRAIARDAKAQQQPLSLAALPALAAMKDWDRDMEFVTRSDNMGCLVGLPQQSVKAATARLAEVTAGLDLPPQAATVVGGKGEAWATLLNDLTVTQASR